MRRVTRQRLALLAVTALLLLAALWAWQRQQQTRAAEHLLPIAPASITRIGVQLPGMARLDFFRRDGHWWRAGATPTPAGHAQLNALAGIAAAPVARWLPAAEVRPARLGLAPPLALLWLDGTRLAFGALTPLAPERYVQLPDGRVALISARYSPYLGTGDPQARAHAGTP